MPSKKRFQKDSEAEHFGAAGDFGVGTRVDAIEVGIKVCGAVGSKIFAQPNGVISRNLHRNHRLGRAEQRDTAKNLGRAGMNAGYYLFKSNRSIT